MVDPGAPVSVSLASPHDDGAHGVLRSYFDDIVSRYYGRRATEAEIDRTMMEEPSDDLTPPGGLFWVATVDRVAVGCVGLRLIPGGVGEVTRMFVVADVRRSGVGSRLLTELEHAAQARGLSRLRLDTRQDLVEARRLYDRHGYREVPAFNASPYAAHWLAKDLA